MKAALIRDTLNDSLKWCRSWPSALCLHSRLDTWWVVLNTHYKWPDAHTGWRQCQYLCPYIFCTVSPSGVSAAFPVGHHLKEKNYKHIELLRHCWFVAAGTTFLHYTSRFTMWRAIKTVLYRGPGAWSCLAELVQNHCFPIRLDSRACPMAFLKKCIIVCVSVPFLAAENPFWSELWKQAEAFMTRI